MTDRALSSAIVAEIKSAVLYPRIFVDMEFGSGTLYLWTGIGEKVFNSNTYTGSGDLGTISEIPETSSIRSAGISLQLSGVSGDLINPALTETYRGKTVALHMVFMDEATNIVDSFVMWRGRMDVMTIEETGQTCTITITCEASLIALERRNVRRYTPQDQAIDYAGDKGFDFVTVLQDKEVIWGP